MESYHEVREWERAVSGVMSSLEGEKLAHMNAFDREVNVVEQLMVEFYF